MPSRYDSQVAALKRTLQEAGITDALQPASAGDIAYLQSLRVPESVLAFFRVAEPREEIEVEDARLQPIAALKTENEDAVPGCIICPHGYPVIGTTFYGDVYCLDLPGSPDPEHPAVLLASHDEIEEGAGPGEVRQKMVCVAVSFEDFLTQLAAGSLRADYYEDEEEEEEEE